MLLNKVSNAQLIWQQFLWKIKKHSKVIVGLLALQILLLFISKGAFINGGFGTNQFTWNYKIVSVDFFSWISVVYIFLVAIAVGSEQASRESFVLVTNRLTANLSSILFLVFISACATFLSYATFYIAAMYNTVFANDGSLLTASDDVSLLGSMLLFLCCMLLASAGGYLVAAMYLLSKWTVLIWIAMLFVPVVDGNPVSGILVMSVIDQPMHWNITVFVIASALVFSLATLLTNRVEVA